MKRNAFTLIEALVVIAVVCIGAAFFLVPPHRHNLDRARRASCQSNLKQIGLAFIQYAQDADEHAPPISNWTQLLQPYLKSEEIFHCPSAEGNKSGATDYYLNAQLAGADKKLGSNAKSSFTILCGEGADDQNASYNLSRLPNGWRTDENSPAWRHLEGANYLFADGHVKWHRAEQIFGAPKAATAPGTPSFEVK